ncbi:unnamed protein product [Schistosoma turkestanicum]|nr:unnamed protein product [Schistosoma turkestanicum]
MISTYLFKILSFKLEFCIHFRALFVDAFNSNPPLREKNNRNYIKCLDNDLKIRHQIKLTTGLSRFFLEFSIYEVQMIIIFRDDHLNFIQLEL